MTFTVAITVTVILAVMFVLACIADGDNGGGFIGFTFMLNIIWLMFGLLIASHFNINPDYPPVYTTVKVIGVVDIPNKWFLLVTEDGKEERFTQISSLPMHDVKELVYENYFDTWKNSIRYGINVTKTLEANNTNNKK